LQKRKRHLPGKLDDWAGLKLGGIRDLEQERNKPTWETVLAVAEVLGVSTEAFRQEPARSADEKPKRGRPRKPSGVPHEEADGAARQRGGR
jgi:hypothetical protein